MNDFAWTDLECFSEAEMTTTDRDPKKKEDASINRKTGNTGTL